MATTVSIKLVSGEEWIGQHQQGLVDGPTVQLIKVRKLQVVPNPKGGPGLALMPIVMGAVDVDTVELSRAHIIVMIPVDKDFEKQYLAEVTGIQLI